MKTRKKMGFWLLLIPGLHLMGCAATEYNQSVNPADIVLIITAIEWEARKPGGIEKGIPGWIARGTLANKSSSAYRFWSDRTDRAVLPVRMPQHCVAFERLIAGKWELIDRVNEGIGVPDAIDPGTSTNVGIEVPRYLVQPGWEIRIVIGDGVRSNGFIVPNDGTANSVKK